MVPGRWSLSSFGSPEQFPPLRAAGNRVGARPHASSQLGLHTVSGRWIRYSALLRLLRPRYRLIDNCRGGIARWRACQLAHWCPTSRSARCGAMACGEGFFVVRRLASGGCRVDRWAAARKGWIQQARASRAAERTSRAFSFTSALRPPGSSAPAAAPGGPPTGCASVPISVPAFGPATAGSAAGVGGLSAAVHPRRDASVLATSSGYRQQPCMHLGDRRDGSLSPNTPGPHSRPRYSTSFISFWPPSAAITAYPPSRRRSPV